MSGALRGLRQAKEEKPEPHKKVVIAHRDEKKYRLIHI